MFTLLNVSENTNELSAFIGYVFTWYSLYLIKESTYYKNTKYPYIFVLIGPIMHMTAGFFAQPWEALIINKITFGFLLVVLVLSLKKINFKTTGIILIFMCYFYPYHLDGSRPINYLSTVDKHEINKHNLDEDINLKDFKFINQNLDTVLLDMNKPILIETWNETCAPCMYSIKELEEFIDGYDQMQHVYMYEALVDKRLSNEKVIDFKRITNKSKILIDVDDQFRTKLGMNSYPYFLMFNKEGNLVDYFAGYAPPFKDYFEERITEMYQKASKN